MSSDELELSSFAVVGLRLFTRGMSPREDYGWRVQIPQTGFDHQQADLVFNQLLSCQTQEMKRWAIWRQMDRVHILILHLPSTRRDHVNRSIETHLHLTWHRSKHEIDLTVLSWLNFLVHATADKDSTEWWQLAHLIDDLTKRLCDEKEDQTKEILSAVSGQLKSLLKKPGSLHDRATDTSNSESSLTYQALAESSVQEASILLIPIQSLSSDKHLPEECEAMLRYDKCGVLSCDYLMTPTFETFASKNQINWRAYVLADLYENQKKQVIWPLTTANKPPKRFSAELQRHWQRLKKLF